MDFDFIRNFFKEKFSVALQEEWIYEVMIYLRSLEFDGSALLAAVYEQWLYTDLIISSQPLLSLPPDKQSRRIIVQGGGVIQINSIIDIGSSLYSQYKKLTQDFEDNSGFQLKTEENETNSNSFTGKTKRMLLMEVTDGQYVIKAVEYRPIRALSLLTCPGCKMLLTTRVYCRRGILLLTEQNCVVLGGDDDILMKTGRPVEIMMKYLNIDLIASSKTSFITSEMKQNDQRLTTNLTPQMSSTYIASPDVPLSSMLNSKPVMQVKPLSEKERTAWKTPKRDTVAANRMVQIKQSVGKIKEHVKALKNENPYSTDSKILHAESALKRSSNPSIHQNTPVKRLKVEEPGDDDDNVVVIGMSKMMRQNITDKNTLARTISPKALSPPDDRIVSAYKHLGIETIMEALQSMRFALGPKRKKLAAVMETKPIEPLRINDDGLWALTVALSDQSYECLTCIVSHKFLVELIGWTPEEAMAARASKDPIRRKEGTLRTRNAGQSMRRLDLIWEIEFFPFDSSTPVVHKIDTYAEKFGLIR